MRIVIDMQGAQSESRYRGIGRYTLSFVKALVENKSEHEIILALNGNLPASLENIFSIFTPLIGRHNIVVWYHEGSVSYSKGDEGRRKRAELLREEFFLSLQPDIIHIASLFEGFLDDAVTSIGLLKSSIPVSVTVYDLIPLLNPEAYLNKNPNYAKFYLDKIQYLKNANLYLAISEFSRKEALSHLPISPDKIVNISTAADDIFMPMYMSSTQKAKFYAKKGINQGYILYTGGSDNRKNLPRLIEAYAKLTKEQRKQHPLVFVGRMAQKDIDKFQSHANTYGLSSEDIKFIGYISDHDLVCFYNLAALFVFPSWHEGFGLPALEAMACGTPVIGANNTSLAEVINDERFLFDPFDVDNINEKIKNMLDNKDLLEVSKQHGLQRAQEFSWGKTAKTALIFWGAAKVDQEVSIGYYSERQHELYNRLLAVMPNQIRYDFRPLAISLAKNRYSGRDRQLFIDVSEIMHRDAATGVQRVVRSYLYYFLQNPPHGFSVELVYANHDHGYYYAKKYKAKLLNQDISLFPEKPIEAMRGDIFFALDMQHDIQLKHQEFLMELSREGVCVTFLVHDLLPIDYPNYFQSPHLPQLHQEWLKLVASTDGAICVSHATEERFKRWLISENIRVSNKFRLNWVHNGADLAGSMPSVGIPENGKAILELIKQRKTFLVVGTIEPRKAQDQVLEAAEKLWNENLEFNLVFVGQKGWKMDPFIEKISDHVENNRRLFWLSKASDEYLVKIYSASDCLIAASLDEGFGLPIVEAARHELAVIARDISVFREVAGNAAHYFADRGGSTLKDVMHQFLNGEIEEKNKKQTVKATSWKESYNKLVHYLTVKEYRKNQLLVDVSELYRIDAKTGIQRVVRCVLEQWLRQAPSNFSIEPVIAQEGGGYKYATGMIERFGFYEKIQKDTAIEFKSGDILFILDFQPHLQSKQEKYFKRVRSQGVCVYFLVYDLLPVEFPHYFPQDLAPVFAKWLNVVSESDGVICISETTQRSFQSWLQQNGKTTASGFKIESAHIGCDLGNFKPSLGYPNDAKSILERLSKSFSFLMVGTLEPRKGHSEVYSTFKKLWSLGYDVNLVIVGKVGWMMDEFVREISSDKEKNKHLFYLGQVSDEYLQALYKHSTCLIAASYGEGFGLPLIEAADHGLPIIARDIPIFQEILGSYPLYFHGSSGYELDEIILTWLKLHKQGVIKGRNGDIRKVSWREFSENIIKFINGKV